MSSPLLREFDTIESDLDDINRRLDHLIDTAEVRCCRGCGASLAGAHPHRRWCGEGCKRHLRIRREAVSELKEAIKNNGGLFSDRWVAKQIGVSGQQLHRWIKGTTLPNLAKTDLIFALLKRKGRKTERISVSEQARDEYETARAWAAWLLGCGA